MKTETYHELRGPDGKYICRRKTATECWQLCDEWQGISRYWPESGCYVVKVTRSIVRRQRKGRR